MAGGIFFDSLTQYKYKLKSTLFRDKLHISCLYWFQYFNDEHAFINFENGIIPKFIVVPYVSAQCGNSEIDGIGYTHKYKVSVVFSREQK